MKALSGSYWKFSASNHRRVFQCSTKIALSAQEVGFPVHQKRLSNGFSLAVSFQLKRVPSISPSAQTDAENEEFQIIPSDKPKTVRVRIKLLKECTFGEHFFVVGDDPILGLWDPCEGVPLDWSEGHVWTAEVDIPIGKVIKYKFILRGINGAILWQPGTDRVLQTWETGKIISVSEDWENPDLQNIVEEDFVDVLNEAPLIGSNLDQTLVDKPSEELEEQDLSSSGNGSVTVSEKCEELSDLSSLKDETRLVLDEGVPVLVPGLVPASTVEENEAEDVVENTIIGSDESKVSAESKQQNDKETTAEVIGVHVQTASLYSTETGEVMVDEHEYGEEHKESNILGSDVQWGRRTLQKFLANLGFI